jgi:serine/threonine-protein kinase
MANDRMDADIAGVYAEPSAESLEPTRLADPGLTASTDSELVRRVVRLGTCNRLAGLEGYRLIAEGGVGRVQSAVDPVLGRSVAVKTLRPEFRQRETYVQRLVREARATAQLEHPGVVPVHGLGYDEDHGIYFVMREVQGATLRNVLDKLHAGEPEVERRYTQARLISIFLRVCQTVAYAHSRGAVHRDLKPENIVLGDYGEVIILDWGLVRLLESPAAESDAVDISLVPGQSPNLTVDGAVSGTPKYMSPEQARGDNAAVDERSDVFSLGILLYELLTLAQPFDGGDTRETLQRVANARFVQPRRAAPRRHIPRDLEAICIKAMALRPEDRYPAVQAMIEDLFAFQDQRPVSARRNQPLIRAVKYARRHPVSTAVVATVVGATVLTLSVVWAFQRAYYHSFVTKAERNVVLASTVFSQAYDTFAALEKERARRMEGAKSADERLLETHLQELETAAANHLDLAVLLANGVPLRYRGRPSVRAVLREVYEARADYSLKTRQYEPLRQWLSLLRLAVIETGRDGDPDAAARIRQAEAALRGDGALSLRTVPVPAEVSLYPLNEDPAQGTITAGPPVELGSTPICDIEVQRGDLLLVLRAQDRPPVFLSVELLHGECLNLDVYIPRTLPPGMVYVPAGVFRFGDQNSPHVPQRRISLPGFLIRKTEVSFDEYLEFWRSLADPHERDLYMSRVGLSADTVVPEPAWDGQGRYSEGIRGDRPVVGISHAAAEAYCRWLPGKTGVNYRLPTAEEWEKAARGADGRTYPWGNGYNRSCAFTIENEEARCQYGLWAPPGSFPRDLSVYGVLDLAGNVREWTASTFVPGIPQYQIRGSSASASQRYLPVDNASDAPFFPSDVGFRYVVSLLDWEKPEPEPGAPPAAALVPAGASDYPHRRLHVASSDAGVGALVPPALSPALRRPPARQAAQSTGSWASKPGPQLVAARLDYERRGSARE